MARRYRIRISGTARENPDPAMLAQIVILIGRRLHTEQRQQHAEHANGNAETQNRARERGSADDFEPPAVPSDE